MRWETKGAAKVNCCLLNTQDRDRASQMHYTENTPITSFDLICPAHGGVLRELDGNLRCDRGEVYPIIGGVPAVVQGVKIEREPEPLPSPVIDQLMDALTLPPSRRSTIEQAFAHKFTFVEAWMQTEADQFLHRVAASHDGLRQALDLKDKVQPAAGQVNDRPDPHVSSIFSVKRVRPFQYFSINVRLQNRGATTLSSKPPRPIRLSYDWIDRKGRAHEGGRTPLLDDLLSGRSITVPVFIVAPKKLGTYTLKIRAVQEDVQWFDQSSVQFNVIVGRGRATIDEPAWHRTGRRFDYSGDHNEAIRLLGFWRDTHFDRPVQRIVELGGNAAPMIALVAAPERFNVDIDPFGMIVGNLLREGEGAGVQFVIADGMALPMAPRSIDMLVMFATFHHFPDPVGLLVRLRDFVPHDGLICLMCEPIGHVHADSIPDEYLEEIRKGVNEQSFELWEYQQMFDAAQLDIVAAQIDIGSAKFALRPKRGAGKSLVEYGRRFARLMSRRANI
ncbi:MAG: class I SAM-dependent methyltransferase [Sphingomonas bacterium]|nr:class I SAM-dependent methyltransferase [Sphingomonas bacterium]